jgi:transposase
MENTITETIGCDLGDRHIDVCVLAAQGDGKQETKIPLTRKALSAFFSRSPAHVVLEAGGQSRWIAALVEGLGHRVTVANPRRLKLISASTLKTDRRDSELLARLGRADIGLLSPVEHRAVETQVDLAVPKARDVLVATRTRLVNHVRGTVKAFGERLPTCGAESFARKTRAAIPAALKPALEPLYLALDVLNAQIRELDGTIERVAKRYPDVELLKQPRGVGTLTALVYLLTIEDKDRFKRSRMAAAYIGLCPRKSQSGQVDPQLRITKTGNAYLRRLMVTAANYIVGPFGGDSDLRQWGLKLATRGGKNAKKRAKVAVARKLAVLMHRLWVTGEDYQPLGYRQAAQAVAA